MKRIPDPQSRGADCKSAPAVAKVGADPEELGSKFAAPENMRIPGNFLTNFEMPSIVNPITPALFMPYMPSIPLPTYFPGISPSPLPLPQITPVPAR